MDEPDIPLITSNLSNTTLPWIAPELRKLEMSEDIAGAPPITVGDGLDLASS